MDRRKPIPSVVETQLLVLCRRRCAHCFGLERDATEKSGQICHIDQNSSNNSVENLVFLCLPHYDAYDSRKSQSKGYTEAELKHYRRALFAQMDSIFPRIGPGAIVNSAANILLTHKSLGFIWDDVYDLVFGGFVPSDDISTIVIDMYSGEFGSTQVAPYVTATTQKLLEEHARQEATWPTFTDCDRLDSAFAALEAAGILCRQDFADCLTCGYREIWAEIDSERTKGRNIQGFTFFHQQDTDHAVRDSDIYLEYGSIMNDNIPSDLEIANEVADTLCRHGLEVEWENSISQRIKVTLRWQRRRTD